MVNSICHESICQCLFVVRDAVSYTELAMWTVFSQTASVLFTDQWRQCFLYRKALINGTFFKKPSDNTRPPNRRLSRHQCVLACVCVCVCVWMCPGECTSNYMFYRRVYVCACRRNFRMKQAVHACWHIKRGTCVYQTNCMRLSGIRCHLVRDRMLIKICIKAR